MVYCFLETEKKEESVKINTVESSVDKCTHPVTETEEVLKIQTTVAAAPTTVSISTISVSPAPSNPTPTSTPNPIAPVAVAVPATKQSTPTAEQTANSAVPSVSRTEASLPISKPELKVATIPRQATKRKREAKVRCCNLCSCHF